LQTDELHKPVATHALHAPISKHLHSLAGNKRAVQTAACESPRSVTTVRDAIMPESGRLFWVAPSSEGFTNWPWPASALPACLIAVDCYSALSLTQGSPMRWYRMLQLARTGTGCGGTRWNGPGHIACGEIRSPVQRGALTAQSEACGLCRRRLRVVFRRHGAISPIHRRHLANPKRACATG
jgi:hypothetical protein